VDIAQAQVARSGADRRSTGSGAVARPSRRPAPPDPRPSRAKAIELLFLLLVLGALFVGWRLRDEEYLAGELDLRYGLGIVAGVVMLLLALYPLRKRVRALRNWGGIKHWFLAHMMLGVLLPATVFFHSNFTLGSLNGTVAVSVMCVVVASGFVGRYLYSQIHHGLYGRQMTLTELKEAVERDMTDAARLLAYAPALQRRLLAFDAAMLAPCPGVVPALWRWATIGLRTRWTQFRLLRALDPALRHAARSEAWPPAERRRRREEARRHIAAHVLAARRTARFVLFERLFALWHLLHAPLFVMLILTVAAHVVAVHLY
jgi:hypothetical protein